jgi:N-glycosylase/DNA lyase
MFHLDFKEEISLKEIYESGQCFRWEDLGNDTYRIIAGSHLADVRQISHTEIRINDYTSAAPSSHLSQPDTESLLFWSRYFDLDTSYSNIRSIIPASDTYLLEAARQGAGIRILRQDPWEMMITFIISQRKNIPAIRTCVKKLCHVAGKKTGLPETDSPVSNEKYLKPASNSCSFDLFPTPEEIRSIRCNKATGLPENGSAPCAFQKAGYSNCSLGYRMPYIQNAASWMQSHRIEELKSLSDEELLNSLMEIKGVGIKVASCILLFGFHRLNAFPVDVWMKRVLTEQYPKGFSLETYTPYAGVMQQYLFCKVRS